MNNARMTLVAILTGAMLLGCEKSNQKSAPTNTAESSERKTTPTPPIHRATVPPAKTTDNAPPTKTTPDKTSSIKISANNPTPTVVPLPAERAHRKFTAKDNPTTKSGRGLPDLEANDRPAAWAIVDGFEGEYRSEGGLPLLQWFVDGPTSQNPTFRLEVYEPLLGSPREFSCGLQGVEADMIYAIRALEGTFETGREYNLLHPGDNFIILNKKTNEMVKEIPQLSPGQYALFIGIKNEQKKDANGKSAEALAVTYFTVGPNK